MIGGQTSPLEKKSLAAVQAWVKEIEDATSIDHHFSCSAPTALCHVRPFRKREDMEMGEHCCGPNAAAP